jgi:primosomal replication protein N
MSETLQPTRAQRRTIREMAAMGLSSNQILLRMRTERPVPGAMDFREVDLWEFNRTFEYDLAAGPADATLAVARAVFREAAGGDVKAAQFWLKHRSGWTEAVDPASVPKMTVNILGDNNASRLISQRIQIQSWIASGRPKEEWPAELQVALENGTQPDVGFASAAEAKPDAIPGAARALEAPAVSVPDPVPEYEDPIVATFNHTASHEDPNVAAYKPPKGMRKAAWDAMIIPTEEHARIVSALPLDGSWAHGHAITWIDVIGQPLRRRERVAIDLVYGPHMADYCIAMTATRETWDAEASLAVTEEAGPYHVMYARLKASRERDDVLWELTWRKGEIATEYGWVGQANVIRKRAEMMAKYKNDIDIYLTWEETAKGMGTPDDRAGGAIDADPVESNAPASATHEPNPLPADIESDPIDFSQYLSDVHGND